MMDTKAADLRLLLVKDPDGRLELNLSSRGLKYIPEAMSLLTEVEVLDLSHNPIETLPHHLRKLKHLKKLVLRHCQLTDVGAIITQMTSLEELNLSGNRIRTLPKDISDLKLLKKLVVSKCGLTEVGVAITQLTSLEELDLSGNRIRALPEEFSNLQHLRKLVLWQCGLTKVGSAITRLASLEELDLSGNPIQTLPQDFSDLKHLKKLVAQDCGLKKVHSGITQLTCLEDLKLSDNQIQTLPDEFSNLKHLKKLILMNCELTEVHSAITELTSLEELDLSMNLVQTLPQDISKLKHLKKLVVWECQLTEVGSAITQLTSLEELYLSENLIKALPRDFSDLKHLKKLQIRSCQLTKVGSAITELTSLEELDLSFNEIQTVPQDFSNLKHLTKLALCGCGLTDVCSAVAQLTSLEKLDFSLNRIQTLPENFSNLKNLKTLLLVDCGLTEISSVITKLTSLKYLSVRGNGLKELPLGITNLKNLAHLNLGGNPLRVPPIEFCKQGVKAIFSYLAEIRLARATYQKVVLLGFSGAGKTSLAKTLVNNEPSRVQEGEETIVLDRIVWEPTNEIKDFSVTLIDFGGNVRYKIVHHLFIDKSALFLLVVKLEEYCSQKFETHIGSWLKLLLTRVKSPHWWLVFTHADKCSLEEITAKTLDVKKDVECIYEREGLCVEKEQFEILVTSSKDMTGIVDLQRKLLSFAGEKSKVISPECLELLKQLQHPTQPYLKLTDVDHMYQKIRKEASAHQNEQAHFSEKSETVAPLGTSLERATAAEGGMQSSLKSISAEGPGSAATADDGLSLESILQFSHDIGVILWYRNTNELSQFIFHNPTYLTDLLKDIFTEHLQEDLHLDSAFHSKFSERTFEKARDDLLKRGIMSLELLKCIWKHKKVEEEVFKAMIDLFEHLDFCYAVKEDDKVAVTSLCFPWFLAVESPKELDQALFGLPEEGCHRITFEYEFRSICPPPMFEKFAVRMHRHCKNKASRKDWKNGFQVKIKDSLLVVRKFHGGRETVIRFTVEGKDVVKLWEVLTIPRSEMRDVMEEWPGLNHGGEVGFRYDTFILCPHCVQQCIKPPYPFPGTNADEECPEEEMWMTCGRTGNDSAPTCLVYNVKDLHKEQKDALQQFTDQRKKEIRGDVRLIGYVKETYSALGDEFLEKLTKYAKSVGIIMSRPADGRQPPTGTVFRVGSRFLMTNQHVVDEIAESVGGYSYLGDPRRVFVSFVYGRPTQAGERFEVHLDSQSPVVWESGQLDAAVLQLDTQSQIPPPLGPLWGNVSCSTTLYLIGHDNRAGNKRVVDLQCPVRRLSDLPREFLQRCPDSRMNDPRRTLLTSSLTKGSSGSPGFDEFDSLVVMYATGYPQENVRSGTTEVEQAINIDAIREQLMLDNPQLAEELFPTPPVEPMVID